jgi:hypothetical protein
MNVSVYNDTAYEMSRKLAGYMHESRANTLALSQSIMFNLGGYLSVGRATQVSGTRGTAATPTTIDMSRR